MCALVCACERLALLSSMQRAAILSSAASLAPPYFWILSQRKLNFCKQGAEHKTCDLILSTILFETFLFIRIIQRDTVINVKASSSIGF
jgi:hypothetical protein